MKMYEVIIIGGGSAGFSVIEQLAGKGVKVAVVENRVLGGSCPNFACIPSKALIKCADVLHTAQNASQFGIIAKEAGFNWKKVQNYRSYIVSQSTESESKEALAEKGIDLLWGSAKFISDHAIEVDGKQFASEKFAITTGSKPFIPQIPGIDEIGILDSDEAIQLRKLPKFLGIVGAGPVGIELAQLFGRFGVSVTVIVRGNQILSREEPEIAEVAKKHLEKEGVKFLFDTNIVKFSKAGRAKQIHVKNGAKHSLVSVDEILMAIGRVPNIDQLHLDAAGVLFTKKGIRANEYLQSSKPHIFAAGDAFGNMQFTHVAYYEGNIIGQNILGKKVKADHRVVPRGTFTDPEIGSVGMLEKEAKEQGLQVQTAVMEYGGARGFLSSDPDGLSKIVINKKTREFVGASIIGKHAAEIVHLIALSMYSRIKVDDLSTMMYAFPTYAGGSLAGMAPYVRG